MTFIQWRNAPLSDSAPTNLLLVNIDFQLDRPGQYINIRQISDYHSSTESTHRV